MRLRAVREALLVLDDAVVEEDGDAGHDEHGDDVLRELVDLAERLRRPEDEQVHVGSKPRPQRTSVRKRSTMKPTKMSL